MATAVWQDVDGDWDNTSNWSGGAGTGGVPANNDTVVIASGTQDIDTNLTTGLTGITMRIGPGFSGNIGTSSSWLDIDGGTFDFDGRGQASYFTGTWTTVNVLGGSGGENMMNWQAASSSDIGTLRILGGNGKVTVGANAVLDTVDVLNAARVQVDIGAVTSLDNVTVDTGIVTVAGNIASELNCKGGSVTVSGTATVATLNVQPSGVCIYNSSGTVTTLNVYGFFDARANQSTSVTVTTPTLYEGGTIDLRNGLANFTLTNDLAYKGGIYMPALGSSISVS
jgi:hypothetical protein